METRTVPRSALKWSPALSRTLPSASPRTPRDWLSPRTPAADARRSLAHRNPPPGHGPPPRVGRLRPRVHAQPRPADRGRVPDPAGQRIDDLGAHGRRPEVNG